MVTAAEVAAALDQTLRSLGSAERAEHEKRYLRSDLCHYGARVPAIRAATKRANASLGPTHALLFEVVHDLWSRGVHECRMAGVELLRCNVELLSADDLGAIERLLREARTWAIIDPLAVEVVGRLYEMDAPAVAPRLDRWAIDKDFWLRRSALLALLPAARRGELQPFLGYAESMLSDREFFIRKAIGWVLREGAKQRPDEVAAWVRTHLERVAGVAVREAVKPLPSKDRDELLAAHRARRR